MTNKLIKSKILIILILVSVAIIHFGIKIYEYYSPAKERRIYMTSKHNDDTLRIAYIGDSWAFGHRFHSCRIQHLIKDSLHKPIIAESYGINGFTSKEIYNALFEIDILKQFMEKGYNYCYISAGINDCNKKVSPTYYKKSMDCIIQFMLANQIRPIIQEIPDFNILDAYKRLKTNKKLLRCTSMFVNGTLMDCKQQFRDALDELIQEKGYQNKVSVIRYKSWNNNYKKDLNDLYISDQMHINEKGYSVLDSVIAKEILKLSTSYIAM